MFAAFSGSHQDAIAKGMRYREEKNSSIWNVPYLPIDPTDVGRVYEADVIRINSQSGKGGIGYLMEKTYALNLPAKMREVFGYHVKSVSDHAHKELTPLEVYNIFMDSYVNIETTLKLTDTASAGDFNAFEEDLTLIRAIQREDIEIKDANAFVYCALELTDATVGEAPAEHTYTAVDNPEGDPSALGYYVLDDGEYVLTEDTVVQSGTTYYTRN